MAQDENTKDREFCFVRFTVFTEKRKRLEDRSIEALEHALEGEASRELQFALRVELGAGDLAVVRISQNAIRVGELRRVGYVEGVTVQL